MEVVGEVAPGRVELAQIEGKKNVWPIAWGGNIHSLKSFEIPLARKYDGDEKGNDDQGRGANSEGNHHKGNQLPTRSPGHL